MATGQLITGNDNTDDYLLGGTGDDTLRGLSGNDTLDGGAGSDSLAGGLGDDTYLVDSTQDVVAEAAGEGSDTVLSSVSFTLGANVESLQLTGNTATQATGNALDNVVVGNGAHNTLAGLDGDDYLYDNEGDDTLLGGNGRDTLYGGIGQDSLVGGAGDDTYYLFSDQADTLVEAAGEGTDTVHVSTSTTYTLGANIENGVLYAWGGIGAPMAVLAGNGLSNLLTGSGAGDKLQGNAGDDTLLGLAGNDQLQGGTGNDSLDGGTGADTLAGGADDDTYVVDHAGDVVNENADEGWDTVQTALSWTLAANIENLTLTGSAAVNGTGNALDNTLTGNAAGNQLSGGAGWDALDGGAGADTLIGGTEDDWYVVDNSGDVVVELAGEGYDGVQSSIDYTLGTEVEYLMLAEGSTAANGTGNAQDNELYGNALGNTLRGLAGNDLLDGAGGADTLIGGTGNDTYYLDSAADSVQENAGEGTDNVYAIGLSSYTLSATLENLYLWNGVTSVAATGNAASNIIGTSSGADTLAGLGGDDTLTAGSGNDRLYGDDVLVVRARGTLAAGTGPLMEVRIDGVLIGTVEVTATAWTDYWFSAALPGGSATKIAVSFTNDAVINGADRNLFVQSVSVNGGAPLASSTAVLDRGNYDGVDTVPGGNGDMYGRSTLVFTTATTATVGGNDSLDGSAGADFLSGGLGNDTYVVDNAGDVVEEAAGAGTDLVRSWISHTLAANVENLLLAGGAATNGTGNALDNTLTGNAGNNLLDGGAGNDTLSGGGGNDRLDGGLGNDSLAGGTGNDTYVVDSATDTVTENAGEGTDTVESSLTWTLGATLENLRLTGGTFVDGTGNAGNNLIEGNSGDNVLSGGGGTDTLRGGEGNDTYNIDSADDVIAEDGDLDGNGDTRNGGVDTVNVGFDYTLGANLENLTLSGSAVNGTGNALDNTLTGNAANNVLTGGAGYDFLDGGAGADTLVGGADGDTYVVDNAGDVITEAAGAGVDSVLSSITLTLQDTLENLYLQGNAAINGTGNAQANLLQGNGGANTLWGLGGNDTLQGGSGNDTLRGGTGDDSYIVQGAGQQVIEADGEGTDLVRVQYLASYTLAAFVENGAISSAGFGTGYVLNLTGNTLANNLAGSFGNDSLSGLDGNDTLGGGYGNDTLNGGTGADSLTGGQGDDTYVIDNALDRIVEREREGIDSVLSALDFSLAGTALENLTLTGSTAVNATGNASSNALAGNAAANTLSGGAGNDTLDGGAGADTLVGGTGNDTYVVDVAGDSITELAGEGIDTVRSALSYTLGATLENLTLTGAASIDATGNALDNVLTGNSGQNVFNGLGGADTFVGGAGGDTYYLDSASDVVIESTSTGWYAPSDTVHLGFGGSYALDAANGWIEYVYADAGAIDLVGNGASTFFFGSTAGDRISAGAGDDTISGGDGNDTLVAGASYDVLQGDAGTDTYIVDLSAAYSEAEISVWTPDGDVLQLLGVADKSELRFQRVTGSWGEGDTHTYWNTGPGTTVSIAKAGGSSFAYVDLFNADGSDSARVQVTLAGGATVSFAEIKAALQPAATAGNDTLYGFSIDELLAGGNGDDLIDGVSGNDTLQGGAGNDQIRGYGLLDGGDGGDNLWGAGELRGGAGGDYIVLAPQSLTTAYAVYGGDGNDTITNYGYYIYSGSPAPVGSLIDGGLGNDTVGLFTKDTFVHRAGDGADTVSAGDAVIKMEGLKLSDLLLSNSWGSQLVIANKTAALADSVTITNYYASSTTRPTLRVLNEAGTAYVDLSAATIAAQTAIGNELNNVLTGTEGADTLDGAGGDDYVRGRGGNDVLYGSAGVDGLSGEAGNDTLYGGSENDNLDGGIGDDYLDGGSGNDQLTAYSSSGSDTLAGGSGNDLYNVYGFEYGTPGNHAIVENDATAGNLDRLLTDINPYRMLFEHVGNDLRLSVLGGAGSVVVKDWYSGTSRHVETIQGSGYEVGSSSVYHSGSLQDTKVQSLVDAMVGFAPAPGQAQFTDATLLGVINQAWAITTEYYSD